MVYSSSGFDFSNHARNTHLKEKGFPLKAPTKTGTTIVGCLFKDGLILGADTRATAGDIVEDPNCLKIHYISEFIRGCGAGTAADTDFVTTLLSSNVTLHSLSNGRRPRVATAVTMAKQLLFQYQGNIGAALIIGGVDETGPHLFTVAPHGSTDKLPYVTMGSGSLAAMAVFESDWQENMELVEAKALVIAAVSAGIFNDLGSGSNVDVCIITKDQVDMIRGAVKPNQRGPKEKKYVFPKGTTAFTSEEVRNSIVEEEVTATGDSMDTQ